MAVEPLYARLLMRNLSGNPEPLDGLQLFVRRYSNAAVGGPKYASLYALGSEAARWRLFDMLRCPVEIYDQRLTPVWWGYVQAVRPGVSHIYSGASLEKLANRVRVTYQRVTSSDPQVGTPAETAWADDLDSQAEYGIREYKTTKPGNSLDSDAVQYRDTLLQQRAWPPADIDLAGSTGLVNVAELEALGWWETLAWRYYGRSEWRASNDQFGAEDTFAFGHAQSTHRYAQQFLVPAGETWEIESVSIEIGRAGANAQSGVIVAGVYTNHATLNQPDAIVGGTRSRNCNTISQYGPSFAGWTFPSNNWPICTGAPTTGTYYWLSFERQGPQSDGSAYFTLYCTLNRYIPESSTNGIVKVRHADTGVWSTVNSNYAPSTPVDLRFRTSVIRETTALISDIIAAQSPFLTVEIKNPSGRYGPVYRPGDRTAKDEIEALLAAGTADGGRHVRLTAEVGPDRRVLLRFETPYAEQYRLSPGKRGLMLRDPQGVEVFPQLVTAGVWATIQDANPLASAVTSLAFSDPVFIEEAEYDARSGLYIPSPRDAFAALEIPVRAES